MITVKLPHISPHLQAMVLYGLGLGLMKGISLLMLPWLTNTLPQAEFGRLELILSIAVFASVIAGLGLQETLCRFVGQAAHDDEKRDIAAGFFGIALIAALMVLPLLLLVAWAISMQYSDLFSAYELSLVLSLLAFESCINLPLTWMRMQNQAKAFFVATTGRALLNALLVVILVNMGRGVQGVLEAGFITAFLQLFVLCHYQYKSTGIHFNTRMLKPLLTYGLPLVATGLTAFALNGLDRWLLQGFTDSESLALYAVAAKFALGMILLQQPFSLWWFPRRFDVMFNHSWHQAANTTSLGIACLSLLAIILASLVPALIHWLLPSSYAQASAIAGVLLLATLFKEAGELLNMGCMSQKSSEVPFYINLATAITGILTMVVFGREFGLWGIAGALAGAQFIRLCLLTYISHRIAPVPYAFGNLLLMLTTATLVLGSTFIELSWPLRVLLSLIGILLLTACVINAGLITFKPKWRVPV